MSAIAGHYQINIIVFNDGPALTICQVRNDRRDAFRSLLRIPAETNENKAKMQEYDRMNVKGGDK